MAGHVRDWLHVDDHCAGILLVLRKGRAGEKYNVGGGNERTNLQIVDRICDVLEALWPAPSKPALKSARVASYRALKTFVPDRPGHDRRYAIDAGKIRKREPDKRCATHPRRALKRWRVGHFRPSRLVRRRAGRLP